MKRNQTVINIGFGFSLFKVKAKLVAVVESDPKVPFSIVW